MKSEDTEGYIQLISENGNVIAQGKGRKSFISYFKTEVWSVQPGQSVVFSETSNLIQPFKFKNVLHNDDDVYLYDCNKIDINCYTIEPNQSRATKVVKAKELETSYPEDLINTDFWVAYCNGQWVGTSEC